MDKTNYFNDLMARTEELLYHELSDMVAWKTEYIGTDFIQSKEITGETTVDVIESCLREIIAGGLIKDASYSIGGESILFILKVRGCIHIPKEVKLQASGIKPYNCPIINMVLDQLVEKLDYATTYAADMVVDETTGECTIRCAIFDTVDKIGNVCDWSDECRLIDENEQWKAVSC